jgi:hypothetical protein
MVEAPKLPCVMRSRDLPVAAGEQEDFRLKFADEREAAVTKGRRDFRGILRRYFRRFGASPAATRRPQWVEVRGAGLRSSGGINPMFSRA